MSRRISSRARSPFSPKPANGSACGRSSATARPSAISGVRRPSAVSTSAGVFRPRHLVRGMVGLHASFTVSDETVRAAGNLARELGTVVHVHVAEDLADVDDARTRGFRRAAGAACGAGRAGARLDPGAWRAFEPRAGGDGGRAVVLAGAEPALERRQPRRLRRRTCATHHAWRSAPTAGTATWPRKRPRCSASPRIMATTARRRPPGGGACADRRTFWRGFASRSRPALWAIWWCGKTAICAMSLSGAASWSKTAA